MANISCNEHAARLLDYCLRGEPWPPELLGALADDECSDALFRVVAEGLADRFEPALCDTYAALFAEAIAPAESAAMLERMPEQMLERYRRVRVPRLIADEPRSILVLSRVTLGADVAVTSVILDAAKRRFPEAAIYLAGPRKNWELFASDPRILHLPVNYRRGTLRQRLASWPELRAALSSVPVWADSLVIDPDSRLTQLGLLPVCPEERYRFFESRSYGGDGDDPLPVLARRWASQTFGIPDARPYVAVGQASGLSPSGIAISLGVGENPAKRIPDPFEAELLALLAQSGEPLSIDQGAGGEEAERVERALTQSGAVSRTQINRWSGSFAGFASIIASSRLYVGYDSAGQHVAAACGVPLISVFAGFSCARMFARWRPAGRVIRVENQAPTQVLEQVRLTLPEMLRNPPR